MVAWTGINGSSAISAIGIEQVNDEFTQQPPTRIHVRFKVSRKTYVYEVGEREYFDKFVDAASKGRFYVFVIKERFDYVEKY